MRSVTHYSVPAIWMCGRGNTNRKIKNIWYHCKVFCSTDSTNHITSRVQRQHLITWSFSKQSRYPSKRHMCCLTSFEGDCWLCMCPFMCLLEMSYDFFFELLNIHNWLLKSLSFLVFVLATKLNCKVISLGHQKSVSLQEK